MPTQLKPNDILVATLSAPEASTLDLVQNNIKLHNTSLLTKDEYKETPFVKKHFTNEEGVFQEDAFNKAYQLASMKYADLEEKSTLDKFNEYLEYSKYSRYRPLDGNIRDTSFKYERLKNPLEQSISLTGINLKDAPLITEEEAAQLNKIWDSKNNKWLNETAEDRAFYKKALGDTLVYAKYDKTGEQLNPVTGQMEYHQEGEWMTDEDGNYFTRTLGDEELLNKQVVSLSDILTKEHSALNKIDFFDSDGYDKSVAGTVMKTLTTVAPYMIPGVNTVWGGITAVVGLSSVLPTMYKSMESLVLGEDVSHLSKAATLMENWFRKFDTGTSRKGRSGFWNIESLGNLVADTAGQLYQQKFAASLAPKFLSKYDDSVKAATDLSKKLKSGTISDTEFMQLMKDVMAALKKLNRAAQSLSLGYMGLVQAADVYNEALNAGYDRRTAGLTSLLTTGALFGIMNFNESARGVSTWFLGPEEGYQYGFTRGPLMKLAKSEFKGIQKKVREAASGNTTGLAYKITEYKNKAKDALLNIFLTQTDNIPTNMLKEGIEEVSEEVIQDAVKGMIDTLGWLGFTGKQGSFGGWDNVFSKEGLARYSSTFFGGAIGGGVFAGQRRLEQWFDNKLHPDQKTEQEKLADIEIADAILEGRYDELMKEVDRAAKLFDNKYDSITVNAGGENFKIGDGEQSLSEVVKTMLKNKIDGIKTLIEQATGRFGTLTDFLKKAVRHHFTGIFKDYNFDQNYLKAKWEDAVNKVIAAKLGTDTLSKEASDEVKKLDKKALEDAIDNMNGFYTGKNYIKYILAGEALFNQEWASSLFPHPNNWENAEEVRAAVETYALMRYGKTKLEEDDLENYKKELQDSFKNGAISRDSMVDTLDRVVDIMMNVTQAISPDLKTLVDNEHAKELINWAGDPAIQQEAFDNAIKEIEENESLTEAQKQEARKLVSATADFPLYATLMSNKDIWSLNLRFNFDLFKTLKDSGAITILGYNEEQEKVIKDLVNDTAAKLRINEWNANTVETLINTVNKFLNSDYHPAKKRLAELADDSATHIYNLVTNKDKVKDVSLNRIKSLLDYALKFDKVDAELKSLLTTSIAQYIKSKASEVLEYESYDVYGDPQSESSLLGNFLNLAKVKDDESLLRSVLNFKDSLPNTEEAAAVKALNLNLDQLEEFLNKTAVESPVVSALKKIGLSLGMNGKELDLFSWLNEANNSISDIIKLINFNLLGSEKVSIAKATMTLRTLLNILEGTRQRDWEVNEDGSLTTYGGSTELMNFYARNYAGITEDKPYLEASKEDIALIQKQISDIEQRLNLVNEINDQRNTIRGQLDNINRKNFYSAYAKKLAGEINLKKDIGLDIILPSVPDYPEEEDYEKFIASREQDLFNALQTLKNSLTPDQLNNKTKDEYIAERLAKLVQASKDDPIFTDFDKATGIVKGLETDNPTINSYFFAYRLVSLLNYSAADANADYIKILEANKDARPKFDLELAIRAIIGWDKNTDAFKAFAKQLNELGKTNDRQAVGNILGVFGPAGSGKTFILKLLNEKFKDGWVLSALAQEKVNDLKSLGGYTAKTIKEVINDAKPDLYDKIQNVDLIIGKLVKDLSIKSDPTTAEDFSKTVEQLYKDKCSINQKGNVVTITFENLNGIENSEGEESKGLDNYKVTFTFEVKDGKINDYEANYELEIADAELEENDKLSKNLVIDESTLLSKTELAILHKLAQREDKKIILLGDPTQLEASLAANLVKLRNSGISQFLPIAAPLLSVALRFDNSAKEDNANALYTLITAANKNVTGDRFYYLNQKNPGILADKTKQAQQALSTISLQYRISSATDINPEAFIGDLITSDKDKFEKYLDNIVDLVKNNKKTLAVIVDDPKSTAASEISEILTKKGINDPVLLTLEDLQGGERDYIITYRLAGNKGGEHYLNILDEALKIYTAVSRSKVGGLYFDDKGLFDNVIKSEQTESISAATYQPEPYNDLNDARVAALLEIAEMFATSVGPASNPEPEPKDEPVDQEPIPDSRVSEPAPEIKDKVVENPINDDESSDTNSKKNYPNIKDIIFQEGAVIQTWYIRLGFDHQITKEGESILGTWSLSELDSLNSTYGDMAEFLLLKNLDGKYKWLNRPKEDSIKEFLKIRATAVNSLEEGWTNKYRLVIKDKEDADHPYMKTNELWEKLSKIRCLQVKRNDIWITVGLIGNNKAINNEGKETVISQKLAEKINNGDGIYEFKLDQDNLQKASRKEREEYAKQRHIDEISDKIAFVRGTGLRRIIPWNSNKVTLGWLKKKGFEFEQGWNYSEHAMEGPAEIKTKFLEWYKRFAFSPGELDETRLKKVANLYRQPWIVIKYGKWKAPVLINAVCEDFLESSGVQQFTSKKFGTISPFYWAQIARSLAWLIEQTDRYKEESKKEWEKRNEKSPYKSDLIKKVQDLKEHISGYKDQAALLGAFFLDLAKDQELLPLLSSQLGNNITPENLKGQLVGVSKLVSAYASSRWPRSISDNVNDGLLETLRNCTELNGWFFTNVDLERAKNPSDLDEDTTVTTGDYETPNFYLDMRLVNFVGEDLRTEYEKFLDGHKEVYDELQKVGVNLNEAYYKEHKEAFDNYVNDQHPDLDSLKTTLRIPPAQSLGGSLGGSLAGSLGNDAATGPTFEDVQSLLEHKLDYSSPDDRANFVQRSVAPLFLKALKNKNLTGLCIIVKYLEDNKYGKDFIVQNVISGLKGSSANSIVANFVNSMPDELGIQDISMKDGVVKELKKILEKDLKVNIEVLNTIIGTIEEILTSQKFNCKS